MDLAQLVGGEGPQLPQGGAGWQVQAQRGEGACRLCAGRDPAQTVGHFEPDPLNGRLGLLDGVPARLEVVDDDLSLVVGIKKIDSETKQPLFGAVFNLYDLKGNLLGEYTTDNRGIIEFPKAAPGPDGRTP